MFWKKIVYLHFTNLTLTSVIGLSTKVIEENNGLQFQRNRAQVAKLLA